MGSLQSSARNLEDRFAAYPSAVAYIAPGRRTIKNAAQHLLWGDWVGLTGRRNGAWHQAKVRGVKGNVWVHQEEFQSNRLLEVNFVDIGQGDGCLVVTPEDKWIVIDAGEKDNMYRFLRWRFGRFQQDVCFESFIVTHPDKDHYRGFGKLLGNKRVKVETLFHNGIVERKDPQKLGPARKIGGINYLEDIVRNREDLDTLLEAEKKRKSRKIYTRLLRSAVESGRVENIRMLSAEDHFLPGYEGTGDLTIQVLAPVLERNGLLRRFGSDGETKNGHSIVLRLQYGYVSVLLGGDLNTMSEQFLLEHYTGIDPRKASADELEPILRTARGVFACDVAKACHHGSPDFSTLFLRAVNPIATVISSGDNESYAHPRPDALGSFGRYGRGGRPLIFSTELARSGTETIKHPYRLRKEIKALRKEAREGATQSIRDKADEKLTKLLDQSIERSVAVYGMISLRTDGERVVMAQRLERPRNKKSKWDIHRLEPGPYGLTYQSKHLPRGADMRNLSKRIFLDGLGCATRAWYARRLPRKPPSEGDRFRLEQGLEIGRLAKDLYPEGIEVTSVQVAEAVKETKRLMGDRKVKALFEAAFQVGDSVARADILVRIRGGWKLIEVKSSSDKTTASKLRNLLDDLTYTTLIARESGARIKEMSLLLVSKKYRKAQAVEKLFTELDRTAEVSELLPDLRSRWKELVKTTSSRRAPRATLVPACNACEYFSSDCIGKGIENPVTDLPRISGSPKKMEQLAQLAKPDIHLVPDGLKLTDRQARVREAVCTGQESCSGSLADELGKIQWPVFYLDFETTATAIPLYPEIAPWEPVVTQFSVHKRAKDGAQLQHFEYLAEFDRDCQKDLATRLLQILGRKGSIVVYTSYERQRIQGLARRFPQQADRLLALIPRLYDLEKVISDCYYHPDFHGSTSIKRVLPVLVPKLTYKTLNIQNGDEAVTYFARAALGQFTEPKMREVRKHLLEYCKMDTLAMVKLNERLSGL